MNCHQSALPAPLLPQLPQLDAGRQALLNRLLRRRQPWQGTLAGKPIEVALLGQMPASEPLLQLPARIGQAALQLQVSDALLDYLLAPLELQRDFHSMPPTLQGLLLEQALLPWIEALELQLGEALSLDGKPAATDCQLALQVSQSGKVLGVLGLQLSLAAAERLASVLEQYLSPARHPLPGLRLRLSLQRGCQQLSLAELRSLQAGDVLMLDCPAKADGLLVLADGRRQARYQRQSRGLKLLEALQPINPTTESAMGQDADDGQLDDVPLTVVCQVGSLQLSLGQLRELGEGSVLTLPAGEAERVELLVNGRCVGRGELVAIGDGLGVRLTRLSHS